MENFIKKSNKKYNNRFDFSESNYVNCFEKITIKCKLHNNIINIVPVNHLQQVYGGCNNCRISDISKIELNDDEILKDINIEKYKHLYHISNKGRCFSKRTGIELKTVLLAGYKSVKLWDNNRKMKTIHVHYLVFATFSKFTGNKKNMVIDHIDGNKLNNDILNLRYVSQSTNIKNAYANNKNMQCGTNILMFDINDNFIKEFDNILNASKYVNLANASSIYQCLYGIYDTAGGYKWKYKEQKIEITSITDNLTDYISLGIIDDLDFSNYFIDKSGNIINKKNKSIKSFLNMDSYECFYLYSTTKIQKSFRKHRLLGKLFLENGNEYFYNKKYVINHKDGNKQNNALSNLEWITYKQNTVHSIGRKVAKVDKNTNKIIKIYECISDAYIDMDKPRSSVITKICNNETGRKTLFGYKWQYVE